MQLNSDQDFGLLKDKDKALSPKLEKQRTIQEKKKDIKKPVVPGSAVNYSIKKIAVEKIDTGSLADEFVLQSVVMDKDSKNCQLCEEPFVWLKRSQ